MPCALPAGSRSATVMASHESRYSRVKPSPPSSHQRSRRTASPRSRARRSAPPARGGRRGAAGSPPRSAAASCGRRGRARDRSAPRPPRSAARARPGVRRGSPRAGGRARRGRPARAPAPGALARAARSREAARSPEAARSREGRELARGAAEDRAGRERHGEQHEGSSSTHEGRCSPMRSPGASRAGAHGCSRPRRACQRTPSSLAMTRRSPSCRVTSTARSSSAAR